MNDDTHLFTLSIPSEYSAPIDPMDELQCESCQ
jgi:hypothetical protein